MRKLPPSARRTGARGKTTWCWRRWIGPEEQDFWMQRLEDESCASWVFTERPQRARVSLDVYVGSRAAAVALARQWRGSFRSVNSREWIKTRVTPPTRIGKTLEIIHEKPRPRSKSKGAQLYIPHGLAFGSGEHATTSMLLRELARVKNWSRMTVLDLGTGSGVLALTARLLGAKKIVATDFDPDAVRTARQNEVLNFVRPLVRWRRADVRELRATVRYDLVVANLFSGILTEAARQIATCVFSGGELWLSGILTSQEKEVIAAYHRQGLQMIRAFRRGKWVMLRLARSRQEALGPVGGMKKATQTK